MTILTVGDSDIDTTSFDLNDIVGAQVLAGTATSVTMTYPAHPGYTDTYVGSGFAYTSAVDGLLLNQGVFNGFSETYNGQFVLRLEGFSIGVPTLSTMIDNYDNAALFKALFSGDDTLLGGAGDDTLDGGSGSNVIFGGVGNDLIGGSLDGFDRVNGNLGNDTIIGASPVGDWLLGGQGNDRIDASLSGGHNIVNGNIGNDTVFGGFAGDTLRGGQGDDRIAGGVGNDEFHGDLGHNTLTGGAGADTYCNAAGANLDEITDFSQAQGDHIRIDPGLTWTAGQEGANVHVVVSNGAGFLIQQTQLTALADGWISH